MLSAPSSAQLDGLLEDVHGPRQHADPFLDIEHLVLAGGHVNDLACPRRAARCSNAQNRRQRARRVLCAATVTRLVRVPGLPSPAWLTYLLPLSSTLSKT